MQDPMRMIISYPQYLNRWVTILRYSPLVGPLFLHRHMIVHQYLVLCLNFNLQRQDQEQELNKVHKTLPYNHDESPVLDYSRLAFFLEEILKHF